MKAEVIEERENRLMSRKEAWVGFEHSGKPTPGRKELLPEIAKLMKTKEELVIIDKIFTQKGMGYSKAKILVYSKKEDIPEAKLDKMLIRMGLKEPEKKEEAEKPQAPPKEEEKPGDEKKEEGKQETEEKPEEKKE